MTQQLLNRRTTCRRAALALAASALLGLTACGTTPGPDQPTRSHGTGTAATPFPRPDQPASEDQVKQTAAGMYQRSAAMVEGLQDERGNAVVSPLSLDLAIGMLREGAHGATAAELDRVWGSGGTSTLRTIASAMTSDSKSDSRVELANLLLTRNGKISVNEPYRTTLTSAYGAKLDTFDEPAQAADKANAWGKEATHGLVERVIPPDQMADDTLLVLANATYFKGPWSEEMQSLGDQPFTTTKGAKVQTPMMGFTHHRAYLKAPGLSAVRLPYQGGYSMWLVLPDDPKGDPAGLIPKLAGATPEFREVKVTMPSFTLEQQRPLKELLQHMGISTIFDEHQADLTGIAGKPGDVIVQQVRQSAKIKVDERGTEAAAITSVEMKAGAAPGGKEQPVELKADRPFAFVIEHDDTHAPLFAGVVGDPTGA